jgi:hypothetical protein
MVPQLLRVIASVAATAVMLLGGAVVLLVALNLQGLIAPSHSLLDIPRVAALSSPGGALAEGLAGQVSLQSAWLSLCLSHSLARMAPWRAHDTLSVTLHMHTGRAWWSA